MKSNYPMVKRGGYLKQQLVFFSILLPIIAFSQTRYELDESFNPTSLKDWPTSKARIEYLKPLKESVRQIPSDSVTIIHEEVPAYVFRVQLGSTNNYDDAIALEMRAQQDFKEQVLLQFDSPYYKIRVGKLNNRDDAQLLQQKAIRKGYRRAWVIRTENKEE